MPSTAEEQLYLKQTGKLDTMFDEDPIEPSYPEDYFPGTAAIKGAATAVTGGAAMLSMMLQGGKASLKGAAKKQGGWIGSDASKMSLLQKAKGQRAYKALQQGENPTKVFKETGWFSYMDEHPRYVDFDFVDEMAAGPLYRKATNGVDVITPGASLSKHAGAERIQIIDKKMANPNVRASVTPGTRRVNRNPLRKAEFDEAQIAAHETQHIIALKQGKPSGASSKKLNREYEGSTLLKVRMYQHKLGEVEARTVQGYRMITQDLLDQGVPPERIKKTLRTLEPKEALHAYESYEGMVPTDLSKIWATEKELLQKFPTKKIKAVSTKGSDSLDLSSRRPSHNRQNRLRPHTSGEQKEMESFLDQHDYTYFLKKDGSVSVDIYDSAGDVKRHTAKNMKELKEALGY